MEEMMRNFMSKAFMKKVVSMLLLSFIMTLGAQEVINAAPQDDTSPPDMPMKPAEPHPHR